MQAGSIYGGTAGSGVFSTLALLCHRLQVMALVTQICKEDSGAEARTKTARVKGLLFELYSKWRFC